MERQHVITLAAALALLAGCAAPTVPVASVAAAAPAAAGPKALKVNKQHASVAIAVPETRPAGGKLAIEVVFRDRGYALQAVPADVAKITVALKTRAFLLWKTVATADVKRENIAGGRAVVEFTGLKAGNYRLDLEAFDAANAKLGATTVEAAVEDAATTVVDAKLRVGQ